MNGLPSEAEWSLAGYPDSFLTPQSYRMSGGSGDGDDGGKMRVSDYQLDSMYGRWKAVGGKGGSGEQTSSRDEPPR